MIGFRFYVDGSCQLNLKSFGVAPWPHIPAFLCHAPTRIRLRYPDHPGMVGPWGISTAMIFTHVLNKGGHGVRSPIDKLEPFYTDCLNSKYKIAYCL